MEETHSDTAQNESPPPSATQLQSDNMGKNQSISLGSPDGPAKFKRMYSQNQLGDPDAQRVAQILWSTGNLDEPIPSGFYSILPVSHANPHFT